MQFRRIIVAVYSENHTKHKCTLWAKYRGFSVKAGSTYSHCCALND
jgi:hypothetical protein